MPKPNQVVVVPLFWNCNLLPWPWDHAVSDGVCLLHKNSEWINNIGRALYCFSYNSQCSVKPHGGQNKTAPRTQCHRDVLRGDSSIPWATVLPLFYVPGIIWPLASVYDSCHCHPLCLRFSSSLKYWHCLLPRGCSSLLEWVCAQVFYLFLLTGQQPTINPWSFLYP